MTSNSDFAPVRPISHVEYTRDCRYFPATVCKHDAVHKTGNTLHTATLPKGDRSTATGDMYKQFGEDRFRRYVRGRTRISRIWWFGEVWTSSF